MMVQPSFIKYNNIYVFRQRMVTPLSLKYLKASNMYIDMYVYVHMYIQIYIHINIHLV
jgi:hypothetical protein